MDFVGYDIETESLDPEHPEYALQPWRVRECLSNITLSCAYFKGKRKIETNTHTNILRDLKALKKPVATWNGMFDVAYLYAAEQPIKGINWIDAMNLWKFLENGQDMPMSWTLKAAARKFLKDWPRQKEFLELKDEELPDPSDPYWKERVSLDAEATALIAEKIWPQLTPQQQNLAKIQSVYLPMVAKSWVNGIRIDMEGVRQAHPEIIENILQQEMKLGLVEPGSTADNYIPSKVLRSPTKLRKLLYEDYGLPCTRWTDGGKIGVQQKSTDKAALTYLAEQDDRVQEIMIWRKNNTILSKFINTPMEACEYLNSNTTHAMPRVFATYTGRGSFASKVGKKKVGMALHQLPRGPEIRSYILPTRPGDYVVEFDVMAQEARWMAIFADDPVMQRLFNSSPPYNDIHSYMGAQLIRMPFEDFLQRKAAHDPEIVGAHGSRNLGKFCIAEGQLIDTDKGSIPIEQVSLDMLVWDGVEYVRHDGVICNGLLFVITRDGITGTPDHEVLTKSGWKQLQEIENGSILRRYPQHERKEVRGVGDSFEQLSQTQRNYLCRLSVQLWQRAASAFFKLRTWLINTLQKVLPQIQKNQLSTLQSIVTTIPCSEKSMHKSEKSLLQRLWRSRHTDEVPKPSRMGCIHHKRNTKKKLRQSADRSYRQQWPLRTGKFESCKLTREYQKQRWFKNRFIQRPGSVCSRLVALIKTGFSKHFLLSIKCCELTTKRLIYRGAFREGSTKEIQGEKKICYDILNAGPRNRFTIQGKVIRNCNLSFNYRISAASARSKAKVDYGIDATLDQTESWKNTFLQSYTGIPQYWRMAPRIAQAQGYCETKAGRRYKLTRWGDMSWSTSSSAINQPIQGSSADQKELAMAVLTTKMPDLESRLMFEMHDAIHFSIPGDYTMGFLQKINKILDNIDYKKYWGVTLPLSFPWEGSLGPNEGSKIEFGYDVNPDMTIDQFYKKESSK